MRKEREPDGNGAVSRSQRRRDALELKSLAAQLIGLNTGQLGRAPLDASVRAAVDEARRIRSNIARKRQTQYIAKLLRRGDAAPITAYLESLENEARQLGARHHRTEAWRDLLIEKGDQALGELISHRPDTEAQTIRQLARNAQRQAEKRQPPTASRALFRLLREMDEAKSLPPCPL